MSRSPEPDREIATQMVPLLERGEEAFRVLCASRGERFCGTFHVVTQVDYVAYPLLCLRHAVHNAAVHILCEDGALFALLARLTRR